MNEPDDKSAANDVQSNGAASAESDGPSSKEAAAVEEVGPTSQTEEAPKDELTVARAESGRLRDQLLRTAADFDNFRKRSRREIEDAHSRGRQSVIKDLLPVFDNLERAASHAEGAADAKAVADGLRIVLKQFTDTLEKMGVTRVPSVGIPFDPSVHEAIQHLESPEHDAGVVMAEVQSGYRVGNQLIRAALVVVSKGAPSSEGDAA